MSGSRYSRIRLCNRILIYLILHNINLLYIFSRFVTGLVYYAIAFHSKSFSDDRYLNILYCALAEIPAYVCGYYAVNMIGRPRCTTFFLLTCGIFTIILPYLPEGQIFFTFFRINTFTRLALRMWLYKQTFHCRQHSHNELRSCLENNPLATNFAQEKTISDFIVPTMKYL